MPFYELHVLRAGSVTPFVTSPRSNVPAGPLGKGETLFIGTSAFSIDDLWHRLLPATQNDFVLQTALVVSDKANSHAGMVDTVSEPWLKFVEGGDFVPWPLVPETKPAIFEGVGKTLEEALKFAHGQIPPSAHKDFAISQVLAWGLQRGGIANQTRFYVKVIEDKNADFKSDMSPEIQLHLLSGYIVGNG